ncbi:MAG TPA: exodeoxyribonuclease VII small subunit [Armatimonadetes bacterium]|nr:exodeoxyribonuclease VII small subunit [Armatimonadota bacterium]
MHDDPELAELTFEQALKELEEIVAKLEEGQAPLEESLMLFERGAKLAKFCERKLDWVERKIKMVVLTDEGEIQFRDFETEVDESAEGTIPMDAQSVEMLEGIDEEIENDELPF